ncbi:MAG: hypothetical protein AABZ06_03995 [Bdellovibrionota bacterium]
MFSSFTEINRHTRDKPWTYEMLDKRQRALAVQVQDGGKGGLLLSEVAPVITLGKRSLGEQSLLLPHSDYEARGIAIYRTDRGGLATYHGPGQWVLFVVDSLERLTGDRRGVRKAVEGLLNIARQVAQKYKFDAEIRDRSYAGLWTKRGKIASVGVHVDGGVLLHGLALNVFKTETSFFGIKPCGLDAEVDFLIDSPSDAQFVSVGEGLLKAARGEFWHGFQKKVGDGDLQTTKQKFTLTV